MYQMQRMQVWASMFCMGNPDKKQPTDIIKLYFDDDDGMDAPPLTDDEIKEMQAEMDAINAQLQAAQNSQ